MEAGTSGSGVESRKNSTEDTELRVEGRVWGFTGGGEGGHSRQAALRYEAANVGFGSGFRMAYA